MPSDFDLLLSIFPFEKEWYAARAPKVRVEFVGHPVVDRFQRPEAGSRKPEISVTSPLILLLPGSRAAEVRRHLPVLLDSAERIHRSKPEAGFKIVWPNEELRQIAGVASSFPSYLEMQIGGLDHALAGADLAIAKSGTVALECAFFAVPAVVFYKAFWPSYALARMVVSVNHLAMPNLLAGEAIFPEFVQHAATPDNIARAALELLNDPERRGAIRHKLSKIVESLGPPGAARRATRAILSLLQAPKRRE
jgi:lipid-A-disaccharide synthase